ncbi:hypothetical protein [Actinoplanes friuliensis]|jgi:hypothetical protein|uniref:Uncharacterized protein n=1 Tax=Actinoplanes friuliensis DSM 7358 TaxID=1246995 RepID=U5VXC9_9ACTN|nr:hypothetical protein [Actinoplanes friuliensis]AGZ41447.1 hypothetical protein AFR_15825 [Actinoplanes friuliensis DSM 7358]
MRTRVELAGSEERVRELADLLTGLRDHRDDDPETALLAAPDWLFDAFKPERTMEEAEAWLVQWRAAPDKLAFERDSGWTASGWLHWFSADNDLWRLGEISVDEAGSRLVVALEHDDDPIPFEALRWLALTAGLRLGDETRVA